MRQVTEYLTVFEDCAILCFDIAGFYDLLRFMDSQAEEAGCKQMCAAYHELFRAVVRKMEAPMDTADVGLVLANRMGDGAFVIFMSDNPFDNVRSALACAGDLRECYAGGNTRPEDFPPESVERLMLEQLKIAVHVGKVYRYETDRILLPWDQARYDYVSHDMHLCARIMRHDYGNHHDIILSEPAWELAGNFLKGNAIHMKMNVREMELEDKDKNRIFAVSTDAIDWDEVRRK